MMAIVFDPATGKILFTFHVWWFALANIFVGVLGAMALRRLWRGMDAQLAAMLGANVEYVCRPGSCDIELKRYNKHD